MEKSVRYRLMIIILLLSVTKLDWQQDQVEVLTEQKGIADTGNENMKMLEEMICCDIQTKQYWIKPLEQYPFD